MATIRTRKRKDGSLAYLSEVRIKRDGEIIHRESKTFDRLGQAKGWADSREKRFAKEMSVAKRPQKAKSGSRRPTADELDALTEFFEQRDKRRSNMPMNDIMWFAIHSARRQAEITDLLFSDNDK